MVELLNRVYSDFKPQLTTLATIVIIYISIKLLGEPISEFIKGAKDEVVALFSSGAPLKKLNALGMILFFILVMFMQPSVIRDFYDAMLHEKTPENVELAKFGTTCFVSFMFVILLLFSIKLSRNEPP